MLWVCDKCFKYMSEGLSWELHVVRISSMVPSANSIYYGYSEGGMLILAR